MSFEVECRGCLHRFTIAPEAIELLNRIAEQGPWIALGDGETTEDAIWSALNQYAGRCPSCGEPTAPREESVSRFAREMLACW